MSETIPRQLMQFFIAVCIGLTCLAGHARGQYVSIRPDRLREGDGKTRNVTLEANVIAGASLNISVAYSSDPAVRSTSFIPKFVVQDNTSEDRNPQEGKIRLILPKAFDKTGVYVIEVDEPRSTVRLVHESNNSSYFRQFADWLIGAAGGGERGAQPKSAIDRIEEASKLKRQDNSAIWMAPMPTVGQPIDQQSPSLKIRSAVMPAWSTTGTRIACSVWRGGKWVIAVYTVSRTGEATELWKWIPHKNTGSDFSPVWSPDGYAVAFARRNQDQKSDIWMLQLDRNHRPKREIKLTDLGSVQGVLGWDKDIGVLFDIRIEMQDRSSMRQIWASKITLGRPATDVQRMPLSDAYNLFRGAAPRRQTLIYNHENDAPPVSVLYEMNSSGRRWILLIGEVCSYNWPTVSHDGRWLAFYSDCNSVERRADRSP